MVDGRFPTVPEYYMEHINKGVDLTAEPKQCCPFHQENTPSFSYNIVSGRWSCFGKCHAHGGVLEMHRRWFHYNTIEEAEADLRIRYRIPEPTVEDVIQQARREPLISDEKIENEITYSKACSLANTPERWIELDLEMSKTPYDRNAIQTLINKWTGVKSVLD